MEDRGPKPVGAAPKTVTTEVMLSLPEDGKERWLIRGELREKPRVLNDPGHSRTMARLACLLQGWLDKQPQPRGELLCGNVGARLQRDPDTTLGIDIAYVSAEGAACETALIEGAPILAVEILSRLDTQQEVNDTVDAYLQAGVALVWIIDPRRRTIHVLRAGQEPLLVNIHQELSAEPHLLGFCIPAAQLFV